MYATIDDCLRAIVVHYAYWCCKPIFSGQDPIPDNNSYNDQTEDIQWHCGSCGMIRPVSWWRHQMETFSALLAICAGNSPVTDELPSQRPVTRSFDVFLDLCLNGWLNNRDTGDLIRHRAHYDATVMYNQEAFVNVLRRRLYLAIVK